MKQNTLKHIKDTYDYPGLEWRDDLKRCPSQCSFYFQYKGERYELYLRWRHQDPWTASFIYYSGDLEDYVWHDIEDFPAFKEDELQKAKDYFETMLDDFVESDKDFYQYFNIKPNFEYEEIF